MLYALSIDWLSFFCKSDNGGLNFECDKYQYKKAPHGTRQFRQLIYVSYLGEDFAEVQCEPCSTIIQPRTLIVKFCNRWLYHVNLFHLVNEFMQFHRLFVLNVSRVDICADCNTFYNGLNPRILIEKFLSGQYRHVGRGNGNAHFNHFSTKEGKHSISHVTYTGLSFGSNTSDCRAYLYNKTYELLTIKDKPHIRQLWRQVGLENSPQCPVWRLEISLKSGAMRFKDKINNQKITISNENLCENTFISLVFHTFAKSLFSFVRNRVGITNISREKRIQLYNDEPYINRAILRDGDSGNRPQKILIKSLWQMSQRYRGHEIIEDEGISKMLALELAKSCDLGEWFNAKHEEWKQTTRI